MPPEGVVDASRGLLGVAGHGLDKHLERALQQHVDAAVVVVVVAAPRRQRSEVIGRRMYVRARACACARHSPYPVETLDVVPQSFPQCVRVHALVHGHPVVRQVAHNLKVKGILRVFKKKKMQKYTDVCFNEFDHFSSPGEE